MVYTDRHHVIATGQVTGGLKASGYLLLCIVTTSLAACATTGAVPRPFPGAVVPVPSTPTAASPRLAGDDGPLLSTALELRGVPYRNGGSDPSGFDCSGFVQYVFSRNGRAVPREVRDQFQLGRSVTRRDVHAGDLLFFRTEGSGVSHVGIALDEERFVHAPSSRGVVRVEPYTSKYWSKRYVGARRVL